MNVKANKIDGANATIEAQITNEEVSANVEKIAKQLAKTTNIPGRASAKEKYLFLQSKSSTASVLSRMLKPKHFVKYFQSVLRRSVSPTTH